VTGLGPGAASVDGVVTRQELLEGISGRRVSTVLFAVQRRTAHLSRRARNGVPPAICERRAAARERAFLAALAAGREEVADPGVRELERFADAWADLVPAAPGDRAELAHLLGRRYRFRESDVPRVRRALHLDEEPTRDAFLSRHGVALASVYVERLPLSERVRWRASRLATRVETLPPFWAAFSLTLTQTVGAGVLALPIALAGVSRCRVWPC